MPAYTNDLRAFIPENWSKLVISKLYQTNVAMAVVANTDYEGEFRGGGSRLYVRTYGRVTWTPYTKGSDIQYETLAPGKEYFDVNDSQQFAFAIDDIDGAQADMPIEEPYAREAAISLNELIDTKIFSYYTSAPSANVIGTSSDGITLSDTGTTSFYAQLVEANKRLDKQNVPQEGRWIIVGSDAKAWAMLDTTLIKALVPPAGSILNGNRLMGANGAANNYLGELAGFQVFWSNNLPKLGASGAITANIFGQGRPVSYANQFQEVERIRLQDTFATAVRGLILHDGTVFSEHKKRLGVLYTD